MDNHTVKIIPEHVITMVVSIILAFIGFGIPIVMKSGRSFRGKEVVIHVFEAFSAGILLGSSLVTIFFGGREQIEHSDYKVEIIKGEDYPIGEFVSAASMVILAILYHVINGSPDHHHHHHSHESDKKEKPLLEKSVDAEDQPLRNAHVSYYEGTDKDFVYHITTCCAFVLDAVFMCIDFGPLISEDEKKNRKFFIARIVLTRVLESFSVGVLITHNKYFEGAKKVVTFLVMFLYVFACLIGIFIGNNTFYDGTLKKYFTFGMFRCFASGFVFFTAAMQIERKTAFHPALRGLCIALGFGLVAFANYF